MQKKDKEQIMREFVLRRDRQFLAIAMTLLLLLLLALVHNRPDLAGEFSRTTIASVQFVVIVAFIGFSAINWRCPSCNKYLGHDINRRICNKCRTRLR